MLKSNLLLCLGLALIGTACNHENDRAMTPANGSLSSEPSSNSDYSGTPSGDPTSSDSMNPNSPTGSGSGTTGSGSGTTGSGSGTTGSGSTGSGTTGSGSEAPSGSGSGTTGGTSR